MPGGDTQAPRWHRAPDPESAFEAVVTQFRAAYGRDPDGVWAAPGRANLVGEHVDYNDGLCLPYALAHRTYAAVARRDDNTVRITSRGFGAWTGTVDELAPGTLTGWEAYAVGPIWVHARDGGHDSTGLDVAIDSSVPVGAGVSSSAALVCVMTIAVADLAGDGQMLADREGRGDLARRAVQAENVFTGVPTGAMDQNASIRSEARSCLLLDCRDSSVEYVPLDPTLEGLALVVIDTGAPHTNVSGEYRTRRRECEEAALLLGVRSLREIADDPNRGGVRARIAALPEPLRSRALHVVTEIDRVRATVDLLRTRHLADVGPLLDASHTSLRDRFDVSAPALDLAVDVARRAGALGARLVGAGFGGSVLALAPEEALETIAADVTAALLAAGHARPRLLLAPSSDGAARVK